MRRSLLILVLLWTTLLANSISMYAEGSPAPSYKEYQVKAAYLYNFMKTIKWPKNMPEDMQNQMALGIVGFNPFGDRLNQMEAMTVQGKPIMVHYFDSFDQILKNLESPQEANEAQQELKSMASCHLLFLSRSEAEHLSDVLQQFTGNHPVLIVGESKGFLELGGIINFVEDDEKCRFEINMGQAKARGFKISSKLLRLAERVIREKDS